MTLWPVILCGGAGVRLWPLSHNDTPKPLLAPTGRHSLLQQTLARLALLKPTRPPLLVTQRAMAPAMADEAARAGWACDLLIEPVGRDTAAAVAAAALWIRQRDPQACLLVLPADHAIADDAAFATAIARGMQAAAQGYLVCFGVGPTRADTRFGYIERGAACGEHGWQVARFHEKPPLAQAQAFLRSGRHWWNSGMFLFPLPTLLEELETHAVALLAACEQAVAERHGDVLGAAFAQAEKTPIDRALLEKSRRVVAVPLACGWADLGSYDALWREAPRDAEGNAGAARFALARRNYVQADGEVLLLGVEDLVVVRRGDKLLVAHRDRLDSLKDYVAPMPASIPATDSV